MYRCWSARAVGLDQSAEETIETAAAAGFDGVDLMVRDLVDSGSDVGELRLRMDDLGLRGGAWPLPVNWKNDAETFEADLRRLPRLAATAARLGLFKTGTWVPFESKPVDARTLKDATARQRVVDRETARWIDRLDRIARILDEHGSRLGLEIIGPEAERTGRGVPLVGTYAELLRRFAELREARSNVGVLVDAFHLFAAGEELEEAMAWGESSVVWAHLADPAHGDRHSLRDAERALPGEFPSSRCGSILAELARRGWRGPVTVEPLSRCRSLQGLNPVEQALRVREATRRVWPAPS